MNRDESITANILYVENSQINFSFSVSLIGFFMTITMG